MYDTKYLSLLLSKNGFEGILSQSIGESQYIKSINDWKVTSVTDMPIHWHLEAKKKMLRPNRYLVISKSFSIRESLIIFTTKTVRLSSRIRPVSLA